MEKFEKCEVAERDGGLVGMWVGIGKERCRILGWVKEEVKHHGSDVEPNQQSRGATTLDGSKSTKLIETHDSIQSKEGCEKRERKRGEK